MKKKQTEALDVNKIIKNAQEYAMLSFELEEKREQSLINQSSQMLTAFSIISVALLMLVPILTVSLTKVSGSYILVCLGITLLLLIISMVVALFVQWRYKYNTLPSPMDIFNHCEENMDYFGSEAQRSKSWIETINPIWKAKHKVNDTRVVLITISMITFFCAVASIVISFVYGYIFYFVK